MEDLPVLDISYLAAPYSHSDPSVVEARITALCKVDAKLMRDGIYTVSPLLKHFVVAHENLPTDYEYWRGYSEALLCNVDTMIVVTLDGWRESIGVTAEIEMAKALDIAIRYVDENGNDVNVEEIDDEF